ncbi:MAG: SRPBCC family protein [Acidimicrobiales bacterium]
MARCRGTVVSSRSAEETFDYLAEFSNAAAWDPGVRRTSGLDDGPVALGSVFRLDVAVGSRIAPLDYHIVSYRRPERVVLVGENGTVRSEDAIMVAPTSEGGSILRYDADLRLQGRLSRLDPVLAIPFRRIGDRGLGGLRRVLSPPERRTTTGPWPGRWRPWRSTSCSRDRSSTAPRPSGPWCAAAWPGDSRPGAWRAAWCS